MQRNCLIIRSRGRPCGHEGNNIHLISVVRHHVFSFRLVGLFDRTRMIGRQVWLSVREVIKAEDRMTVCYGHLPEAYAFSWLSGSCSPFTCLPAPSDLCMIWLPSDSSDRKQVAGHEVVQGNVRKQATKFDIQHRFCRCIYTPLLHCNHTETLLYLSYQEKYRASDQVE